ncbi:MAG: hypothetical protein ABIH36_02735 [bacterium]
MIHGRTLDELNDFDLAAIIDNRAISPPLQHRLDEERFDFLPEIESAFRPLLSLWEIDIERFRTTVTGTPGSRFKLCSVRVGIMGQGIAVDGRGKLCPDLVVLDDGRTASAIPAALSINQYAISCTGKIFGPLHLLDDVRQRVARFVNPPSVHRHSVALLLRLVDYVRRYQLRFDEQSRRVLNVHFEVLDSAQDVVAAGLDIKLTRNLIQSEFGDSAETCPKKVLRQIQRRFDEVEFPGTILKRE